MVKHYFPVCIKDLRDYSKMLQANKMSDESISKQRSSFKNELWYSIEIRFLVVKNRFQLILNSEEIKPGISTLYPASKLSQMRRDIDEFVITQAQKWKIHKQLTKGKFIY